MLKEIPLLDEIEHNSITNGDSIELIKKVQTQSAHLILSDIPYGIGADDWMYYIKTQTMPT